MENELAVELNKNIGQVCTIFLLNNFRYHGKIISVLQDFVEILDFKAGMKKIMRISQIAEVNFEND